jgi:hypothetical protein
MLLIGSRATQFHFPDARTPKDYDFIGTRSEVNAFLCKFSWKDTSSHEKKRRARVKIGSNYHSFEFDLVDSYPSSKLILDNEKTKLVYDNYLKTSYYVASPLTLFLLKRSHITFNIHWWKNIYDYLFLKNKIGNIAWENWQIEAYELRFKEILNRTHRKVMNFDLDNSDFFKKSEKFVKRVVEHDSLHYATCFYDKPLFLSAKEDKSKAALSESKVWAMSDKLIVQMIQEECMALSLERGVIPALLDNSQFNAEQIYMKTAGKMVYNYLPPFMRIYAADHFLEILDLKVDYVTSFLRRHPTFFTYLKSVLNS